MFFNSSSTVVLMDPSCSCELSGLGGFSHQTSAHQTCPLSKWTSDSTRCAESLSDWTEAEPQPSLSPLFVCLSVCRVYYGHEAVCLHGLCEILYQKMFDVRLNEASFDLKMKGISTLKCTFHLRKRVQSVLKASADLLARLPLAKCYTKLDSSPASFSSQPTCQQSAHLPGCPTTETTELCWPMTGGNFGYSWWIPWLSGAPCIFSLLLVGIPKRKFVLSCGLMKWGKVLILRVWFGHCSYKTLEWILEINSWLFGLFLWWCSFPKDKFHVSCMWSSLVPVFEVRYVMKYLLLECRCKSWELYSACLAVNVFDLRSNDFQVSNSSTTKLKLRTATCWHEWCCWEFVVFY